MPKLVDNYVLNRKIGAGQYGEVFRGYDRASNNDIAIKSIKRDKVKGKFKQLLQSQIKVLKSCQSTNIIKLYDMKKTANNFYLIMQYCNDGDLQAYVKKKKYLEEDQAIEILCEIIHGFKHLYKHKILHRDLKLANILRHDGITKIADFGFSKMLGDEDLAATILGSPLNMAPEVLKNRQYSNKADIYSLGVCYYWMLFGKPPFNAKNIIQLKTCIHNQEVSFPKQINKISEMSQKLIQRMLREDPKERISWEELFTHQVNQFLEKRIEHQLHLTLTMEGDISENVCKLYLTQNLVIIHPIEFSRKEGVVDYAVKRIEGGQKEQFKGAVLSTPKEIPVNTNLKRQDLKEGDPQKVTEDQRITDTIYNNTFILLNERNKIIFLLSVLNELRTKKDRKYQFELLGCLAKIARNYYEKLSKVIREKDNQFKLQYWVQFVASPSFKNLQHFLLKEEKIMKYELKNSEKKGMGEDKDIRKLTKGYCTAALESLKKQGETEKSRHEWNHISRVVDIVNLEKLMTAQFDFKHYYCGLGKYEMKELVEIIRKKVDEL